MEKHKEEILELLENQLQVMQNLAAVIHKAGDLYPELTQDFVNAQGYDDISTMYINISNLKLMITKLKSKWE